MSTSNARGHRLLRRTDVQERLSIGRTTLYGRLDPRSPRYDPAFPRPVRMGSSIAFVEREIDEYVQTLMRARDAD